MRQIFITDVGSVTITFDGLGTANLYVVDGGSNARAFVGEFYCVDDALTSVDVAAAQRSNQVYANRTWLIASAAPGEVPQPVWNGIRAGASVAGWASNRAEAQALADTLCRPGVAWYSETMGPDGAEGWVLL